MWHQLCTYKRRGVLKFSSNVAIFFLQRFQFLHSQWLLCILFYFPRSGTGYIKARSAAAALIALSGDTLLAKYRGGKCRILYTAWNTECWEKSPLWFFYFKREYSSAIQKVNYVDRLEKGWCTRILFHQYP